MEMTNIKKAVSLSYALPDARLEQEIAVAFESDASLKESIERIALPAKTVDDVCARLDQRRLAHVRQERQHWVECCKVSLTG